MDEINIEEFKRNIKGCLDQLPFVVMRRGKPLFVCSLPGADNNPIETKPCLDCPNEFKRGYDEGVKSAQKQPCNTITKPEKSIVGPSDKAEIPATGTKIPDMPVMRPTYARPSHHPQCTCAICKPDQPGKVVKKDKPGKYVPPATRAPSAPLDIPVIKDKSELNVQDLQARYKASHPNSICIKCQSFNKDCKC